MAVNDLGDGAVEYYGFVNGVKRIVLFDKPVAYFDKKKYKLGEPIRLSLNTNTAGTKKIPRVWSNTLNRFVTPIYIRGYLQFPDIPGWAYEGDKFLRTSMEWYDGYDYGENNAGNSSVVWTPTQAELTKLYAKIPNQSSAEAYFDGQLMVEIDGKLWIFGELLAGPITISADPVACAPRFYEFDYRDDNPKTKALTSNDQILIQGESRLLVEVSPSKKPLAQYAATIKNYQITAGELSGSLNYSTSGTDRYIFSKSINTLTNPTVAMTVVDSRGLSKTLYQNLTIIPYTKPEVSVKAERENGYEDLTRIGISGTYSEIVVDNASKNTIEKVRLRLQNKATRAVGEWVELTATTNKGKFSTLEYAVDIDNKSSWQIDVEITDKLNTVSRSAVVAPGIPLMFIGTDGRVGINTKPRIYGSQLEVNGKIYATEAMHAGGTEAKHLVANVSMASKISNYDHFSLASNWVYKSLGQIFNLDNLIPGETYVLIVGFDYGCNPNGDTEICLSTSTREEDVFAKTYINNKLTGATIMSLYKNNGGSGNIYLGARGVSANDIRLSNGSIIAIPLGFPSGIT